MFFKIKMDQNNIYKSLYKKNIQYIKSNNITIDNNLLNLNNDRRLGLSIILRPGYEFKPFYNSLLSDFKNIDPEQYYYPFEDLHITVFEFIPAYTDFQIDDFELNKYISIFKNIFKDEMPFIIDFSGIVFVKTAGIIKGYDKNRLFNIREKIRINLKKNNIKVKERYKSKTAHMTFCRFINNISNLDLFIQFIEKTQDYIFKREIINSIDMVIHDWYNISRKCRLIKRISFREEL